MSCLPLPIRSIGRLAEKREEQAPPPSEKTFFFASRLFFLLSKNLLTFVEKCGIIEIQKKAGYRIATTIALHKSVQSTPIQPDNRHPRDIITHLFGFCKRFSVDRLYLDGFFSKSRRAETLLRVLVRIFCFLRRARPINLHKFLETGQKSIKIHSFATVVEFEGCPKHPTRPNERHRKWQMSGVVFTD